MHYVRIEMDGSSNFNNSLYEVPSLGNQRFAIQIFSLYCTHNGITAHAMQALYMILLQCAFLFGFAPNAVLVYTLYTTSNT